MKSKKQQKKTSIKSSILVLLLIAILLIASTYAWFTSNKQVTVSSLNVNVAAKNGLQISVDGTNWKSIISNEDITGATATYAAAVNQIPTVMEPVSSGKTVTDGKLNVYYGTVDSTSGAPKLTATKATEVAGDTSVNAKFIVFDLFLKVDAATQIDLTTGSNVLAKDGSQDKGLQNASRVAFVTEGNTASGSTLATIQGLNGGDATTTKIWEPNYDVHTTAGVSAAYDTYAKTTTVGPDAAQLTYNGIIAPIETGVALNSADATYFAPVTPDYSTKKAMATTTFTTLQPGITKVRVYMWVEGQDVDCENGASGTDITYNLQWAVHE